jgi:hypothetical protein
MTCTEPSLRFRPLVHAAGPFVSVFVDDRRDEADARERTVARCSAVCRHLRDMGVDSGVVDDIGAALLGRQPVPGRAGRAIVAAASGVVVDESLHAAPPSTVLRVSDYPFLLPLLAPEQEPPDYLFAAVDSLGADLTVHEGSIRRHTLIEGAGFPVHKPATAGWHGYGDLAHSAEEAVRTNIRLVSSAITTLADQADSEIVFVCGEVRARSAVIAELPERIAARTVQLPGGADGDRADELHAREHLEAELERHRRRQIDGVQDRFVAERACGSGVAVEGLGAVCRALRDRCVDTLLVGEMGTATVLSGADRTTLGTDADFLSEIGQAPHSVVLADEALPFVALATGATVIRARGDLGLEDGVGALLRYPPSPPPAFTS